MKLYKFQEEAYKYFYEKKKRVYFAFDTGLGKTVTALNIAKDFKKVLILCPASIKFVWEKEMEKFNLYPQYYEIHSYDYFREHKDEILNRNFFDLIIFDEAHKLKNPKAKITKLCMKIFSKANKIMLSATPFEKLGDFYSQLRILSYKHPFNTMSYTTYKNMFFVVDVFNNIKKFQSKHLENYFFEKFVYPYVWFLKKDEVIELPDVIEDEIKLKTKSYFKSAKIEINETNALTFFITRFHKETFSKEKIEFVAEFVMNNPKTVVFSFFKEPLRLLKEEFNIDSYFITGDNKKDLEKASLKGDKPLFATFALKEGVNLVNYSNIIFLSLPLAYRDYYQSVSRLHRIGQTKKVYVVKVLSSPIDQYVNKIISQKRNLLEELQNKSIEEIKKEVEI